MLPTDFSARDAASAVDVLHKLQDLIAYMEEVHLDDSLSMELRDIRPRDSSEIRAFAIKLRRLRGQETPSGATARFWIETLDEAFASAVERLDELAADGDQRAGMHGERRAGVADRRSEHASIPPFDSSAQSEEKCA